MNNNQLIQQLLSNKEDAIELANLLLEYHACNDDELEVELAEDIESIADRLILDSESEAYLDSLSNL